MGSAGRGSAAAQREQQIAKVGKTARLRRWQQSPGPVVQTVIGKEWVTPREAGAQGNSFGFGDAGRLLQRCILIGQRVDFGPLRR